MAELETDQRWVQQQGRDLALADYLLSGDPHHLATIQEHDKLLLEQSVPDIYDDGDPRNVLTVARQKYLKLVAALAEQYTQPEELTLVAFHAAIEHLSQKAQG